MDIEINFFIMLIIIVIGILSGAWFINSLIILIRLKIQETEMKEIHLQLQEENSKVTTDYSEKMLNFVRMLTTQVAILQFRTFVDNHEMAKVTRVNIEKLVSDIAKTVHDSININNIDFGDTLFTKEFYESYIIETSSITVKKLLDKAIGIEEE